MCIRDSRKGTRKNFIGIGYILWGIFTILFGTTEWITGGQPASSAQVLMLAATAVVCADALMSFFGSMGNDAGYNAWLNDMMTEQNRGSIGAALATQPIIGTIVGTVVGGMLIGGSDNYMRLFVVMGGFVILFGIAAILFMKDAPQLKPSKNGSFGKQLFSAFNFRELIKMKELVWVFLVLTVYFIAFNVYYPHIGNYMIYYLGFRADSIGIIQGIALIVGMLSVVPASRILSKNKFVLATSIAVLLSFVGVGIVGLFGRPENVDPSTCLLYTSQGAVRLPQFNQAADVIQQRLPIIQLPRNRGTVGRGVLPNVNLVRRRGAEARVHPVIPLHGTAGAGTLIAALHARLLYTSRCV